MPVTITYGPDPSQFGELTLPDGDVRGTVVVVHGGFWRSAYGLELGRPLAADLAARGYAAWNVEYRRVGNGGGWPATFDDVAAALDALATTDLDLDRVVAVGHSAGGHLATWLAAEAGPPAGSPGGQLATPPAGSSDRPPAGALDGGPAGPPAAAPRVRLRGVVSQAGVLDLVDAVGLSRGAVVDFLGGTPEQVPDRYAAASPVARLPFDVPVVCVHGTDDANVPLRQSERFVAAAGPAARLVVLPGEGHFGVIDPASPAWHACRAAVDELLA